MIGTETFDDALDHAIDQVRAGASLTDVLAAHPRHASELRPFVETSMQAAASARASIAPLSRGLADNVTIVRAALERERAAARVSANRQPVPERERAPATPWWARRWGVASLSLPAGAVIFFAFAGAGGAAAATVVAKPDIAGSVASIVTPHWAEQIVPEALGGPQDDAPGASNSNGQEQSPPANGETVHVTLSGVVEAANGGSFTLRAEDDSTWNVQVDVNTNIDGAVLEGASATVSGAQTGSQTVHAEDIDATGGATPTPRPGNGERPATPPGQANTPNAGAGSDKTPNPPRTGQQTPAAGQTPADDGAGGQQGDTDDEGDEGSTGEHAPPGSENGALGANENDAENGGGPKKP
jgi:hypothetical protein